jgi:phage regulator Rha-like protein
MPHIDRRLANMHSAIADCADIIAVVRKERDELKRMIEAYKEENDGLRRLLAVLNREDAA